MLSGITESDKRLQKRSVKYSSQFNLHLYLKAYANIVHYNIISLIQDEDPFQPIYDEVQSSETPSKRVEITTISTLTPQQLNSERHGHCSTFITISIVYK